MSDKRILITRNNFGTLKKNDIFESFPCDICLSRDVIELPYVRKYTNGQVIHICKNCGFIYVKLRRPSHKVAEIWSKEMFGKAYTSKTPLMLARHTYVAEFIKQSIGLKNKNICDVGAGEGQFLNIIKRNYGASVFGIEPSEVNCRMLRKMKMKYYNGTLEEYINSPPHKGYKADIVTMMWTLENATSCKDMLIGARQIIKNNGYLVVATGSRILVPFAKPLNLYLSSNPVDTHPARFSINTLTSLLAITGFKTIHINPYLNDSFVLCVIAKKTRILKDIKIKGDDFQEVCNFFRRWHKETSFYKNRKYQ